MLQHFSDSLHLCGAEKRKSALFLENSHGVRQKSGVYYRSDPMKFARVIGTVVATKKDEKMENRKFLLVQPVDIQFQPSESPMVAIDSVGAGEGELVLLVAGSSARQTDMTTNRPCDLAIMAIVDTVEKMGKVIYQKGVND